MEARESNRLDGILLAPVSAGDFEALAQMRIAAMRVSLERVGRFDPVRALERLRVGFEPEDTFFIVGAEQRLGFVVFQEREGEMHLDHLYVLPEHQGKGVGALVLRWVLERAASLRLAVRVTALRDSEANCFYQRHGFVLMSQEPFDNHYCLPGPG
ncbi:GNAT family N-acetyltransferase [Chromobacterium rhizoryzae]|uniref:GNAT family N-acetyltransferase n=1 Tax=Chromobacterium rhizoryzae TaxID=1778675 RepID=UPI001D09654B|nr:GNAT family N-acetyltransferase [Chromobacterium rhizoryzae]